jgi:hypothetical protein
MCTLGRWFQLFTVILWITSEVRQAGADSIMIDRFAGCIDTTSAVNVARILADFVDTCLLKGTSLI